MKIYSIILIAIFFSLTACIQPEKNNPTLPANNSNLNPKTPAPEYKKPQNGKMDTTIIPDSNKLKLN